MCLVANSLSCSGEFVGLNAKGMALQRKHASVSSPFVQACFAVSSHYDSSQIFYDLSCIRFWSPIYNSCWNYVILLQNPGSCFIKAAKSGATDNLQGSLDGLAWGNCLSMGTSGMFDVIYSEKVLVFLYINISFLTSIQILCIMNMIPLVF